MTPAGATNASLAIAACRAGARGFLDLEHDNGSPAALLALERLARFAPEGFGVKLGASAALLLPHLLADSSRCREVILAGGEHPDTAEWIARLRARQVRVLLEAVSWEEVEQGARQDIDGLILKGHESGGRIGNDTTFILLQRWQTAVRTGSVRPLPVYAQGGIGLHTATACLIAGAAGVVLDNQLLLARESRLGEAARAILHSFDGSETTCLGARLGEAYRCFARPDLAPLDELRQVADRLATSTIPDTEKREAWRQAIRSRIGMDLEHGLWLLGQDAAFARSLAQRYRTVGGIIEALREHIAIRPPRVEYREHPSDVAIIGMACFLPGANDARTYWANTLACVNAVTEVPLDHWDWRLYYDPDPKTRDKICSKWGGFLADMPFDPLLFGMPPNSLASIEPVQLYALEAVRRALADAGYAERPFNRERTAVILGAGGGAAQLAISYSFRSYLPMLATAPGLKDSAADILHKAKTLLPEWTEDSFPGILVNVIAGRVANRFNFGGPSYSIDAACGSSLAALHAGVRELEMGTSDVCVVLGADTVQNPYTYMAFSKTHAFSARGRCSTFDEAADGIVISEGVAAVILKRLADAERDGDRIYAVIKGVGASSDGRDKGLTAPRPEGQLRALRRAYSKANIAPARVEFVEAHGTGTVVGDQTEVASLGQIFREAGMTPRSCAIGSVKSMIGHTKCAAGLAGLINATLALHHKVLPPLLVERPNAKASFEESPFFLNTQARPWIHGGPEPRVAGVSAFGFGGTNFHAVLEEYTGDYLAEPHAALDRWPAELFVWRRASRDDLMASVQATRDALARGAAPALADLAYSLCRANPLQPNQPTLAVVATSLDDLKQKLDQALTLLRSGQDAGRDPRGIFLDAKPQHHEGERIAFLFPGQGSQYPNMLASLAMTFPEVRQAFDDAEAALAGRLDRPLGKFIFPPSAFTPEQEKQAKQTLTRTDIAQPAIGAASLGMLRLLDRLGICSDLLAGHSYGDYVALCAAGALTADELIRLSHERGRVILEATEHMPGAMAAVEADLDTITPLLAGLDGVTAANLNSPRQTVISGSDEGIRAALERLHDKGIRGQRIPVACAFHSPLVAAAAQPFAAALASCGLKAPERPVYANTTAQPYPAEPDALVELLSRHLVSPVRFREEIEALYTAGARIFIEVGPQGVLTGLVEQTLGNRPHLAVASDLKGRPGLVQLQHLLAELLVGGVEMQLERLHDGRGLRRLDLDNLERDSAPAKPSPSTWLVNSVRVRPLHGPEPRLLGQARSSDPRPAVPPARPTIDNPKASASQAMKSNNGHPQGTTPHTNGASHSNGVHHPPAPAAPAAPIAPPPGDEAAQVMLRFQDLMGRFLETQRSVMLGYLHGGAVPASAPSAPVAPLPAPHKSNGHSSNGHALPSAPVPAIVAPPPQPAPVAVAPAPAPLSAQPAAPAKKEPAPAAPPPSTSGQLDRESITTRLLDIVCKRTGYPADMLGLDMDLEADLGIDSIKRVEILGMLVDANGGQTLNVSMEKLTNLKTLRGIIDCLSAASTEYAKGGPATGDMHPSPSFRAGIQRMLVTVTDAPPLTGTAPILPGGTLIVTDDGAGIASDLAQRLRDLGQQIALVSSSPGADAFHADLTDPHAVAELLARVRRECGPVHGIIHLAPLALPREGESWADRLPREVKSLFLLARGLADELQQAAESGNALLLAATAMGGSFGTDTHEEFSPGQGGVAGLVKSLAHEWPQVLVRVVDLNRGQPARELSGALLAEMGDADGPVEVGYRGARRVTLSCAPGPLEAKNDGPLPLGSDSTVLLTGGARGITAAVALELARRYRPNLVLVGRSPLPEDGEAPDTAGITGTAGLKAALIARMRREGRPASPAIIETAYQRLLHDREIRGNIERLRQAGARVHYYQADVRDEAAFTAVLNEVFAGFPTLDGVIHGAGVIQDKLIRDKTPESYDRVFGTKVESALILSRHPRFGRLKFCVFFTSVAGRFGNRGQSDYAAANEVLAKLAVDLDRRTSGRVVSIAWGPWSSIGMVSELEQHLGQRGLQMIPPEVGPVFLDEELRLGNKGECEVVVAGDVGQLACPRRTARNEAVEVTR
jgi:acyl transferase domain-containing protein/NAD(P)-dependent dehydrogenase (short-subunit alcohol dehydrogenase family)/acyl carrier protein